MECSNQRTYLKELLFVVGCVRLDGHGDILRVDALSLRQSQGLLHESRDAVHPVGLLRGPLQSASAARPERVSFGHGRATIVHDEDLAGAGLVPVEAARVQGAGAGFALRCRDVQRRRGH